MDDFIQSSKQWYEENVILYRWVNENLEVYVAYSNDPVMGETEQRWNQVTYETNSNIISNSL